MRIAAIIAEYNPFHTGHAYHISCTRASGVDAVCVILGGNTTQRGGIAVWEKQNRARAALLGGADIVVELPALYTVRNARVFAGAGVAIAAGLGADVLSFGCETADTALLQDILAAEDQAHEDIADGLARGETYARARGEAISARLGITPEALNQPNLTLACEYLRALRMTDVAPMVIGRRGGYHDAGASEGFASASAIRAMQVQGQDIAHYVPERFPFGSGEDALDAVYLYALRGMTPEQLAGICDVAEGLEHRILREAGRAVSRSALLEALKCKRYTMAHLSRVLTQAVCGMTKHLAAAYSVPGYVRVLGMREGAGAVLRELTGRASLPVVTSAAALKGDAIFEAECRATDLYALTEHPLPGPAGQEYTRKFLRV